MTMMEPTTATPCEAAPTTGGLERTRFFARQLVTPDDLTQDQIYFREKHAPPQPDAPRLGHRMRCVRATRPR